MDIYVLAVTADDTALSERLQTGLKRIGTGKIVPHVITCPAAQVRGRVQSEVATDAIVVAVLAPMADGAVQLARSIETVHKSTYFVFVTSRENEKTMRRQLLYGAPPGGKWALHIDEEEGLENRIEEALKVLTQQKRFSATVGRMSVQLFERTTVQEPEYRRLVASDHYLANVLRHAHDAIIAVGPRGEILSWNDAAESMLGRPASTAIGQTLRAQFADALLIDELLKLAEQGDYVRRDLSQTVDGIERCFDAVFNRVDHQAGVVVGIAVIMREVTQQRLLERQAVEAERLKDEFLAMLAHELRNPLAPIRNTAAILMRLYAHDQRVSAAAQLIGRQADHLTALLSDLMDVSRVTRGFVKLQKSVLTPHAFVSRAIEQIQSVIDKKNQVLQVTFGPDLGQVCVDAERLTQVVANILDNASKYSPNGSPIEVDVTSDATTVQISVTDSGEGIEQALMPHIFDLFTQGVRTLDRANGGLGIGLAIVKTVVEMHGGEISATNAVGHAGACFNLVLPRHFPDSTVTAASPSEDPLPLATVLPRRQEILVVDDNEDAALSLRLLIELEGHHVSVVHSGEEALALVHQRHFTIFVLDIGMPGMDGFVLATKLRNLAQSRHSLLIAHTGYGQPEDIARAKSVGFDYHLTKPSRPEDLLSLISSR